MSRTLSKTTVKALKLLGSMIKIGRKQAKMTQYELAERLDCSNKTIVNIEKGASTTAIGLVFEAAFLLGVPLITNDQQQLQQWQTILAHFEGLLPKHTSKQKPVIDDDF